jgi:hypothetical protein
MASKAVPGLAAQLKDLPAVPGHAPWPGHEYVRGWGVFVDDSRATLDGIDLGRPARLRTNPVIGGIPLPARGVLSTGQAIFEILDPAEYQRTRSQVTAAA